MKRLTILSFILLILCVSLFITACGKKEEPDPCAGGHTVVASKGYEATCTSEGLSDGKYCSVCEAVIDEQKATPKKEHSFGALTPEVSATCTENGKIAYYTCSDCGGSFDSSKNSVSSLVIVAPGHSFGQWNEGTPASCEKNGTVGHKTCSACEKSFDKDGNELTSLVDPAKGHNYVDRVCENCGLRSASEGLSYTMNMDYTGYYVKGIGTCTDTEIVIPATYNGFPVIDILSSAFENNTTITGVTFLGNIKFGNKNAFKGCTSLTSITFHDSMTTIGEGAFQNCTALTEIIIPEFITTVKKNAFSGCTGATKVVINGGNKTFESGAFAIPGGALEAVYADSLENWVTNNFGSNPLGYAQNLYVGGEKIEGRLTIPEGIETISAGAFSYWLGITELEIPASLKRLSGFIDCTNLTGVYISDLAAYCSLESEYYSPLFYARNIYLNGELLVDLVVPDTVTKIGDYTFFRCQSIKSVTLGSQVKEIGELAFGYSTVETVTFNEGLEKIDVRVFTNCEGLTAAILPDSLTELGERAFYQCTALKTVKIGTGLTEIKSETFCKCTALSSLTLSEGLKIIGGNAFSSTRVEMVYLPDSVTEIGGYAFADNKALFFARLGPNVTTVFKPFNMCSRLFEVVNNSGLDLNGNLGTTENLVELHSEESKLVNVDGFIFYTQYYSSSNHTNMLIAYIGEDTEITLPEKYNGENYVVAEYAFYGNDRLTSVNLGNGVTNVVQGAFTGCTSIKKMVITKTTLYITGITPSIFAEGFSIYFEGESSEWRFSGSSNIASVTVYRYSATENTDGYHWHYDENGNPVRW